jgi:hypothetical protein
VDPQFSPIPFEITVDGAINGTNVFIRGVGNIPQRGVYRAVLNFSELPAGFHPSAIATYVVSICCGYEGAMRNGGLNFRAMGATGYTTRRVLSFEHSGQIVIEGDVSLGSHEASFKASIHGEARLPDDLAGNSIYIKRIEPLAPTRLLGIGSGSLFANCSTCAPVTIETLHELRPTTLPNPLRQTQFRVVTESGVLTGQSYSTQVHSIMDGANSMNAAIQQRATMIAATTTRSEGPLPSK